MPFYLNGEFVEKFMQIVFPAGHCVFDLLHLDAIGDLSVWSV